MREPPAIPVRRQRHFDIGDAERPKRDLQRRPQVLSSAPALEIGSGGESGIRTHDTVTRLPHFECGLPRRGVWFLSADRGLGALKRFRQ